MEKMFMRTALLLSLCITSCVAYYDKSVITDIKCDSFVENEKLLTNSTNQNKFVLGLYQSWGESPIPTRYSENFKVIKEAGFDVVQSHINETSISEAENNGVKLLGILDDPPSKHKSVDIDYIKHIVNKYKNSSSIYGWYLFDEPSFYDIEKEKLKEAYEVIKSIDSVHPVYIVLATKAGWATYDYSYDVLGVDRYPIPEYSIIEVEKYIDWAREYSNANVPIWAIIQAFPVEYYKESRPPTRKELRSMVYLALTNNVKGILYYTLNFKNVYKLVENNELWDEIKNLNKEIKHFSQFLSSGSTVCNCVDISNYLVKFIVKENTDKYIIICVNTTDQNIECEIAINGLEKIGTNYWVSDFLSGEGFRQKDKLIKIKFASFQTRVIEILKL